MARQIHWSPNTLQPNNCNDLKLTFQQSGCCTDINSNPQSTYQERLWPTDIQRLQRFMAETRDDNNNTRRASLVTPLNHTSDILIVALTGDTGGGEGYARIVHNEEFMIHHGYSVLTVESSLARNSGQFGTWFTRTTNQSPNRFGNTHENEANWMLDTIRSAKEKIGATSVHAHGLSRGGSFLTEVFCKNGNTGPIDHYIVHGGRGYIPLCRADSNNYNAYRPTHYTRLHAKLDANVDYDGENHSPVDEFNADVINHWFRDCESTTEEMDVLSAVPGMDAHYTKYECGENLLFQNYYFDERTKQCGYYWKGIDYETYPHVMMDKPAPHLPNYFREDGNCTTWQEYATYGDWALHERWRSSRNYDIGYQMYASIEKVVAKMQLALPPSPPPADSSPPSPPPMVGLTCDHPIDLAVGQSYTVTNFGITFPPSGVNPEEICPAMDYLGTNLGPTAWFKIEASSAFSLSTCDLTSFDTTIVVYKDSCTGTAHVCNGDAADAQSPPSGCQQWYSEIDSLEAGTYFVLVGGWNEATGAAVTLSATSLP